MVKIALRIFLVFIALLGVAGIGFAQSKKAAHTFTSQGEDFMLDGKPFIIRSGEMHYPRVPRAMWRDRFRKAKAMGLNTITTYIFWNLHEPTPGKFDFTGNLDVAEFIREAGQEGLYVIARPGPYICTEWDFGGIPAWLLKSTDLKVRTGDPRFLDASRKYMAAVGRQIAPLQITYGGNIIMTQVENEYGSFGKDHEYVAAVKKSIQDAGFDNLLFTSDGPSENLLTGGTLPDTLSVINFGSGDAPEKEFASFAKFRQNVPRMTGEYWIGWFDHWGAKHETVKPEVVAKGVDWMLANKVSFNLYMFHGGTSFGFMNGANTSRNEPYQPDTSSYDYDSPLDEAGRPTAKYFALRDVIKKYLPAGETLPEVPATRDLIEIPAFELKRSANITTLLGKPVVSPRPLSMEEIGQNYGFVLYRKKLASTFNGELKFDSLRDYGLVYIDGKAVGTLDRRLKQNALSINVSAGSTLDILVENNGRINFGRDFNLDRKGIVGDVWLGSEAVKDWEIYGLPLSDVSPTRTGKSPALGEFPAFYRGSFDLKTTGDTFLDTTTWGKGHVWVNGHHLGRFWRIGPQQTLFVPAGWLRKGKNEVVVLDLGTPQKALLRGVKNQIFGN